MSSYVCTTYVPSVTVVKGEVRLESSAILMDQFMKKLHTLHSYFTHNGHCRCLLKEPLPKTREKLLRFNCILSLDDLDWLSGR